MGDAAGNADTGQTEPAVFFHERHDGKAENGTGQAVCDAEQIAKEETDDQDPHKGYQGSFLPGIPLQNKENCKIGKSKLDAGRSGKNGNQGFHITENNSDRGK